MRGDAAPMPGGQRDRRMDDVKRYLRRVGSASYYGISIGTGLTLSAVTQAIHDLHRWDDEVVAVPAYGNKWETSLGWTLETRTGEVSQLRHNATRITNQSHRLAKIAATTTNAFERNALESEARTMAAVGENLNSLADTMEATR